jgi:hypothetical protein
MTTPRALLPGKTSKTGKKSSKKRPRGLPFAKGGDPRRQPGHGPEKGAPNAGRPTNEFILRMMGLAATPVPEQILREIDEHVSTRLAAYHPTVWAMFMRLRLEAWREVCDRGYGRPVQPVAVDTEATRRQVLKTLSNEELIAALHTLDSATAHAEAQAESEVS